MAGALGIDPKRLFSFNFRQFVNFAIGVKAREAKEENHFRRIAWIIASANEDPKNKLPPLPKFWSIPLIDKEIERMTEIADPKALKEKLLKAWIKNN